MLRLWVAAIVTMQLVGCVLRREPEAPPSRGCSGRVQIDVAEQADMVTHRLAIVNDSTNPKAGATELEVTFDRGPYPVEVLSPTGWSAFVRMCTDGRHVCGIEWRACPGVMPGQTLEGFSVAFAADHAPNQRGWSLRVGDCRTGELTGFALG